MKITSRAFKLFLSLSVAVLLFSCKSSDNPELYSDIDYTEEDAVRDEISFVRSLAENNAIKAMWRAKLISLKVPENADAQALLELCASRVSDAYRSAMEDKEYFDALQCYSSLEAVSYSGLRNLGSSRRELETLAYKGVPGLGQSSPARTSVSEMIKGTVTVFVDKGIKIQRGMGYADAVLGSGFFISRDGYIVTNHHVISDMVDRRYEGYSRLYIKLAEDPETRIPAKVVGWDSVLDLALLKTSIDAPYVFSLGSSSDLSVGDKVYAIGSPLGLDKTLTSGIISSTDRQLFSMGSVFQIDAAVNSGNSGGPLIDEQGRVQAVVFAGVPYYQGLNFAIPVEYLKYELPFLLKGGERVHPWFGAFGKTRRLPGAGMKNEGITVFYSMPGGSAYLGGLAEDDLIVGADGQKIYSIDSMQTFLMRQQAGSIVRLSVVDSKGSARERFVYLERRPDSPGYEFYKHDSVANVFYPLLGMKLVGVSPISRKKFSIVKIMRGSTADETGLSENDPVDLMDINFSKEKDVAFVQIRAKKRKNGFLDAALGFSVRLDSPLYF